MNVYWKCNKCGGKHQGKEPPIEHGIMSITVYPNKKKPSVECTGKWVRISYNEFHSSQTVKPKETDSE